MPDRPTVLLIDDVAETRQILGWILERSDFRIVEASDGLEGLARARDEEPDAIVTDLVMPRLGGFELARRLREEEGMSQVPILALSGSLDIELNQDRIDSLFDAFLFKPVDPETLVSSVRALVDPGPSSPAPA